METSFLEDFVPIGDRVLVAFPQGKRMDGGVWVTEEPDTRMDAVVVAVGPRVKGLYVGNTVVAERRSGTEIRECGVGYRLLCEKDVLAVVEQATPCSREAGRRRRSGLRS